MRRRVSIRLPINDERKLVGKLGEQLAVRYLQQQPIEENWSIVECNWSCRSGELDIIAFHGERLVFIEVRTKRSTRSKYGSAAESVTVHKQRQVRATAQVFMKLNGYQECPLRFDVIAVTLTGFNADAQIEHFQGAF